MREPILVTGARGFVGTHLRSLLGDAVVDADVDVTELEAVVRAVRSARPAAVVHLAALSSVAASWGSAAEVWRVNALGTVNVLEAVKAEQPDARVLVVSTGEVYGRARDVPTGEDAPVEPVSPYAASKAAAEIACSRARREEALDLVVARPFMHAGPRQHEQFAIASWTRQIARLEAEGGGTLRVGNLAVRRDIVDVRDVCRAYALLLEPGVAAGTYNVASGVAVPLTRVVELLVGLARCPVAVAQDPSLLRPADVPVFCGDASRLVAATGWKPEIPLEQTLADALADSRAAVANERMAV